MTKVVFGVFGFCFAVAAFSAAWQGQRTGALAGAKTTN
jgi:hypothetical protein